MCVDFYIKSAFGQSSNFYDQRPGFLHTTEAFFLTNDLERQEFAKIQ